MTDEKAVPAVRDEPLPPPTPNAKPFATGRRKELRIQVLVVEVTGTEERILEKSAVALAHLKPGASGELDRLVRVSAAGALGAVRDILSSLLEGR